MLILHSTTEGVPNDFHLQQQLQKSQAQNYCTTISQSRTRQAADTITIYGGAGSAAAPVCRYDTEENDRTFTHQTHQHRNHFQKPAKQTLMASFETSIKSCQYYQEAFIILAQRPTVDENNPVLMLTTPVSQ